MDKTAFDAYCIAATKVIEEVLAYTQRPDHERDAGNEGQVRRPRGVTGAVNSALMAVPPAMVAVPPLPPVEQLSSHRA
jgi:hypothetical protein